MVSDIKEDILEPSSAINKIKVWVEEIWNKREQKFIVIYVSERIVLCLAF